MTTASFQMEMPRPPSLREVIHSWHSKYPDRMFPPPMLDELQAALVEREDIMADLFRLAGVQYGLFPEIVAAVIAEAGLGTEPSPEALSMIQANYAALMERLRREQGFTE